MGRPVAKRSDPLSSKRGVICAALARKENHEGGLDAVALAGKRKSESISFREKHEGRKKLKS